MRFFHAARNAPLSEPAGKACGYWAFCILGERTLRLDTEQGIFTFVKTIDPDARQAAVSLLRRGMVTVPEAAELAGVSRQVVRYWCKVAGVEIGLARSAAIAKAWRKALNTPGAAGP